MSTWTVWHMFVPMVKPGSKRRSRCQGKPSRRRCIHTRETRRLLGSQGGYGGIGVWFCRRSPCIAPTRHHHHQRALVHRTGLSCQHCWGLWHGHNGVGKATAKRRGRPPAQSEGPDPDREDLWVWQDGDIIIEDPQEEGEVP